MPIRTCADRRTEAFLAGEGVGEFQTASAQAIRALARLQAVSRLVELRNPPSNHFEALGGDRRGQYSIRVNPQWRVCFRRAFTEDPSGKDPLLVSGEPYDVVITDHHRGLP